MIPGKAGALTVGCVVAIAASIAGDTSQDLKTGFLLGATPRRQQTSELIGVITSAVFVCLTVLALGETGPYRVRVLLVTGVQVSGLQRANLFFGLQLGQRLLHSLQTIFYGHGGLPFQRDLPAIYIQASWWHTEAAS